jgi:hypothetical protein
VSSTTVAASPSAATETTICTITIPANAAVTTGIQLQGWAAFTVGTSGTACNLKIRQTNTSGTTISATGATTGGIAAANLVDMNTQGLDTAGVLPGQVYVLTLTVTAGAAASTVSACQLTALIV